MKKKGHFIMILDKINLSNNKYRNYINNKDILGKEIKAS
jgi:hypothetical protein